MSKGGRPSNLKIDSEKMREAVSKSKLGSREISKFVLGRDEHYLDISLKNGNINPKTYKTLCAFLKVDESEFIFKEEEAKETSPDTENMITGITATYNKANAILSEIKTQQALTKEQIRTEKEILEILKQINSLLNVNTEKVKAIFTEVKYNK